MEYYIGQEIELLHNGETIKLKIEEYNGESCKACFFYDHYTGCIRDRYSNMKDAFCSSTARNDEKNIIYKQIK